MTSHDAVFKLRKLLHEKKIGHGGTLDPDVVGVLPIAVGKATRVIEYMTEAGKVYRGQICLGFSTTTEDASGEVVERTPVSADLSPEQVDEAMAGMVGDINQTPPMYSAVKVNGRRLYEYARAGEEVERPHRQVSIYDFRRTSSLTFKDDCCYFDFEVACSKGTYIRALARDIGKALDSGAHLIGLERTRIGEVTLDMCMSPEEIDDFLEKNVVKIEEEK